MVQGYARTWYNNDTNEEYTLFAIAFSDSYWKPEAHIGYTYQKYHSIFDSNNWKWGLGRLVKITCYSFTMPPVV